MTVPSQWTMKDKIRNITIFKYMQLVSFTSAPGRRTKQQQQRQSPSAPEKRTSCLQKTTLERAMGLSLLLTVWKRRVCDPISTNLILQASIRSAKLKAHSSEDNTASILYLGSEGLVWPVLLQLPTPCSKNAGIGEAAPQTAVCALAQAQRFPSDALWRPLGGNAHGGLLVLPWLLPFRGLSGTMLVPPLHKLWQGRCQKDFFVLAAAAKFDLARPKVSCLLQYNRTIYCSAHNARPLLMLIYSSDVINYHIHQC